MNKKIMKLISTSVVMALGLSLIPTFNVEAQVNNQASLESAIENTLSQSRLSASATVLGEKPKLDINWIDQGRQMQVKLSNLRELAEYVSDDLSEDGYEVSVDEISFIKDELDSYFYQDIEIDLPAVEPELNDDFFGIIEYAFYQVGKVVNEFSGDWVEVSFNEIEKFANYIFDEVVELALETEMENLSVYGLDDSSFDKEVLKTYLKDELGFDEIVSEIKKSEQGLTRDQLKIVASQISDSLQVVSKSTNGYSDSYIVKFVEPSFDEFNQIDSFGMLPVDLLAPTNTNTLGIISVDNKTNRLDQVRFFDFSGTKPIIAMIEMNYGRDAQITIPRQTRSVFEIAYFVIREVFNDRVDSLKELAEYLVEKAYEYSEDSRSVGQDAAIKSELNGYRTQYELFYSDNGSYKGACDSYYGYAGNDESNCRDSQSDWIRYQELSTNTFWCVDATGYSGELEEEPSRDQYLCQKLSDYSNAKTSVSVMKRGLGYKAKKGDVVIVNYRGRLASNNLEFDNSYDRGQPFPVELGSNRVIQGWEQGLLGVKAGQSLTLNIPSELGYGAVGTPGGPIGPNADLIFDIEVIEIIREGSLEIYN